MSEMRKITAILPAELLTCATDASGLSLTETLKQALRDFNHRAAGQKLLAMRGKVEFALDWQTLRGKDEA